MKKIAISAMLAATLVSAADFNYEISPVVGYLWNSTANETNLNYGGAMGGVENHVLFGLEMQINNVFDLIKPELSVFYGRDNTLVVPSEWTGVVDVMINGVYEYKNNTSVTPFAKAGLGYENYSNKVRGNDWDGFLADVGAGAKIDLTKHIDLKLEGLYMYKMNSDRHKLDGINGEVHNVAALAGLTFSFDEKAAPIAAAVVAAPVVAAVVTEAPKPAAVIAAKPTPVIAVPVAKVCPIDSDKDGVFDPQDKCANTPSGFKVDGEGCPLTATLHLNFATNSNSVDTAGTTKVAEFATFMKESPAYKASIVGHTDSTGSDKFNQNLSEKRASVIKEMLVKDGVAADRLTTSGKGESCPVSSNKTKQGRSENRRIEVELSH